MDSAPAAEPVRTASPAAATATFRRPAAMRAPALTINYAYLRHDLRTLAILGPLMVVILVVAFFVIR